MTRRAARVLFSCLTAVLASLVTCGAGEILVRIARPQLTFSKLLLMTGEQYEDGKFIPFTLKKNYVAESPSMEFPGKMVKVSINSLRLRGPETTVAKRPGTKRILILGDSYTFGLYCEDDEPYPRVLERLYVNHNPRIEVLNAGYTDGWTPDEHYAWLLNRGLAFQPDIVVYGFFIGNDIELIETDNWRNLDQRGLPTQVVNPRISIDSAGRLRSRVADSVTVGTEAIYRVPVLRESHLIVLLNRIVNRYWVRAAGPPGQDALSAPGRAVHPFDPILGAPPSARTVGQQRMLMKLIQGMQDASREAGAEFLLLMIPINFQVEPEFLPLVLGERHVLGPAAFRIQRDPFAEMEPALQDMKVPHVNLLRAMKEHPEQKYFPRNGEVHFNPNGHRFTAETIKEALDSTEWLTQVPVEDIQRSWR
jgi:lysophospholipase L1-like esterase